MLKWNTVNDDLKQVLFDTMAVEEFREFRLVGGTSLSLQLGHRLSDDIDLFTDASYGSVNFESIENYLMKKYAYVEGAVGGNPVNGRTYRVGVDEPRKIKFDVFYSSEPFFQQQLVIDNIRLASMEEIIAMKLGIVETAGRKKDFWDLHELLQYYSIGEMISLHAARFEWTHNPDVILSNFTNFTLADTQQDPICLRGKEWEFIKQDITEAVNRERSGPDYTR